ncbi:hypothetical protein DYBT9623_04610 [Dyadobacter sp. CECT 9623]|uniref:Antitoxin SocA-like Panacea domain-containing protein n=1 Tax=Dyadobacter linearis TaxID=2823330 RepID=A0ABM8UW71_9BACT|nr:Panacea domain-containing protein [Dyadobacter sp. CECT 9623]CAG5073104.1 hypothetical protein DYBT9623_04610 [Dyadobacter sp. CECT 9623]
MNTIEEKTEITISAMLYILKHLGGKSDIHKLFKILYFAEQKHLVKYGSEISGDRFHAMNNGPVPSLAYDITKSLRAGKPTFAKFFETFGDYSIKGISEPDMDWLSESEIACLNESIHENQHLDFKTLTEKSHDAAWADTKPDREIDIIKVAKAGGADKDMLDYIEDSMSLRFAEFE